MRKDKFYFPSPCSRAGTKFLKFIPIDKYRGILLSEHVRTVRTYLEGRFSSKDNVKVDIHEIVYLSSWHLNLF